MTEGGGGDGASFSVFGGHDSECVAGVITVVLQLLVDGDRSGVEVHAIPHKAQALSLTHAGEQGHGQKSFLRGVPDGGEEKRGFFIV